MASLETEEHRVLLVLQVHLVRLVVQEIQDQLVQWGSRDPLE